MSDDYTIKNDLEERITSPLPWIGMYIAAASLVCTVAMAADVLYAFHMKKFWFPCKFFTLNAASLTLLAVAMKLPGDLTTLTWGSEDMLAKLSSTILMTTVMGNFMTSLGSMDGKSLLMNITATGILVMTIIVNLCIQIHTNGIFFALWAEEILSCIFMLVIFLTISFSALTVPTMKKYLEEKYHELCRIGLNREEQLGKGKFTIEKLKLAVKKIWMMAETSSPQFVMGRSVTCTIPGAICLLNALMLVEAEIRLNVLYKRWSKVDSDYRWSTMWILVIQSIGVVVGTISPLMRWFIAVSYKCYDRGGKNYKHEFKVETYWIERLVEWKQSPLPLRIGSRKCRKLLQSVKHLIANFLIRVQIVIVIISKIVLLISVSLVSPIYRIKRLKMEHMAESGDSNDHREQQSEPDIELDLGRYVLLLEGEIELPKKALKKICYEVDQLIQTGKRQQPKNLFMLLKKSSNFDALNHFDCIQVPSLHPEEPPNCWTLPVVTLTSIAIALPHTETHSVDQLISGVTEGIRYAGLVDKTLDGKGNLVNIRNAANALWVGVELYHKWLDEDLMKMSLEEKTSRETLQKLSDIAKETVMDFKTNKKGSLTENPLNWPVKIVAANSMYRIGETLLLAYEECDKHDDSRFFEQLSIMIADILSACLTNLPHIISQKCYKNAIEEREENIRHTARLLGEIEDIFKILEEREIPSLNSDQSVNIDEWRAVINQEIRLAFISSSDNTITSTRSTQEHVTIEIGT